MAVVPRFCTCRAVSIVVVLLFGGDKAASQTNDIQNLLAVLLAEHNAERLLDRQLRLSVQTWTRQRSHSYVFGRSSELTLDFVDAVACLIKHVVEAFF